MAAGELGKDTGQGRVGGQKIDSIHVKSTTTCRSLLTASDSFVFLPEDRLVVTDVGQSLAEQKPG